MADNRDLRDGDNAAFPFALDELNDGSLSSKHSVLDGSGSPTPISPATSGRQDTTNTRIGDVTESAPGTDTASSGLNGRLQRACQRLTSLIALLPAALTGGGSLKVSLQEIGGTSFAFGQSAKSSSLSVALATNDDSIQAQTATLSALASSASSAQALAANSARKGLICVNTDANDCYVKFGTTASATSFTVIIPGGNAQWEMPRPSYTGRIDAIWSADGSGSLYMTELT